jgi:hypothetical protein
MKKYPNVKFKLDGELSWYIACASIHHSSLMDNIANFVITFPSPTDDNQKVISSTSNINPMIPWIKEVVQWNYVNSLPDSTTCCFYLCRIDLPIPFLSRIGCCTRKKNRKTKTKHICYYEQQNPKP